MVSRRSLLAGALGLTIVGAGTAVATSTRLQDLLHLAGDPAHPVPSGPVGQLVSGSFRSAAMQVTTGWSIAYPPGSPPGSTLRVLLVLHGRGSSHTDVFASLKIDRFLAAAVRGGVPPFAVVSVDGGDHTYWHARRSGEDPPAMLLDELLPLLARRGLRTERLALGGWSMGGYGALLLAERLGAARVAAVAVDSPALLLRWQDAAHGAFDDADDFARHNVLTSVAKLRGIPVRVTCGTHDPFIPGVRAFLKSFPAAARDLAPGGHDVAWWQHAAPGQLEFVGRHLTA